MPRARKCTRCNKLYEDYHPDKKEGDYNGLIKADSDLNEKYYNRGVIDFCPECKRSFDEWMKNGVESK